MKNTLQHAARPRITPLFENNTSANNKNINQESSQNSLYYTSQNNTEISYFDYFKQKLNNDYNLKHIDRRNADILKTIEPFEKRSVNASFIMFTRHLPNYLSYYLKLTSIIDDHIFVGFKDKTIKNDLYDMPFFQCNESPLDSLLKLTGRDSALFIHDLKAMAKGGKQFLSTIINLLEPRVLDTIEHLLHMNVNVHLDLSSPLRVFDKSKVLANLLAKVGCSRFYNNAKTGVHYKTLNSIYSDHNANKATSPKANKNNERKNKYHYLDCVACPTRSMFVMLLIGLYIVSARVLRNVSPLYNAFTLSSVPKQISYVLAAGIYASVQMMFDNLEVKEWIHKTKEKVLPHFEDFIAILEYVLEGKAQIIACADCNTPFLIFDEDLLNKNPKLNIKPRCPSCDGDSEYLSEMNELYII